MPERPRAREPPEPRELKETAGTGAGGSSACASPQTSFGAIGQGDSNPNFLSGVGALGTNVMYIFSSYMSLASAGAVSQEIYVQSFDPKSGASKGPSQSLFVVQAFETHYHQR